MSRARQLFVYFERIRALPSKKEELRAYVEEARQRIIEIDLYLFELGQVVGSTVVFTVENAQARPLPRRVRIVLYTRAADEARYNADLLRSYRRGLRFRGISSLNLSLKLCESLKSSLA
ncbi:hypothetical protein CTI12_AA313400 [Artemisia annua]|uniref:Uncharacterized protein n=1 Tax=Artemisia annua TaxID=35608 RepID=A0A2U1N367_ARTAN|nr:hypothetical protein CTI12_AA313400 [Artemisia annua]